MVLTAKSFLKSDGLYCSCTLMIITHFNLSFFAILNKCIYCFPFNDVVFMRQSFILLSDVPFAKANFETSDWSAAQKIEKFDDRN